MSEVIETKPICKQPGRYIGWPTIGRAPDDTLHAVFSGDRDGHICPFGKSQLVSSNDGGRTGESSIAIAELQGDAGTVFTGA